MAWREATIAPPPDDPADPLPFYDSLDQVRFFDETRGIASGYLSKSGENHVFRTEDGGKTWSLTELPEELWVYDSQVTPQGLAWLVGSTGDVLMSADYGRTWRRLKPPFNSDSRSHSVHFLDRNSGVVGSLDGQLKLTRDGGKSWKLLPAPKAAPRKGQGYTDVRIDRVRLVDGGIAVLQLGEAYWRPLSESPWAPLRASGKRLVAFERHGEGLVAVTEALQIAHVAPKTGVVRLAGGFLHAPPLDLAVRDERVLILDQTLNVYQLKDGDVRAGRMLRADRGTHWPIVAWDRLLDGTFLGASSRFFYRSNDQGATWERLGETERAVRGAAARRDGTLVVWDGHGDVSSFDPNRRVLSKVPGLNGLDVVDVFRRGELWVAFGGMQDETTRRIEVARTYFSGQFAGTVDYGFVAVSKDDGITWNVVDRWKEGGVQQIHLTDDDSITLLSWLCAVRRGRLQLRGGGPPKAELTTVLPATEETRKDVPYVERASVVDFFGGSVGWVHGWTHHVGTSLYRTKDGGKSWSLAAPEDHPAIGIFRLGSGVWLGFAPPSGFLRWDGAAFRPEKVLDGEVRFAQVDSAGCLLAELEDGALWMADETGRTWSQLRPGVKPAKSELPTP